MSVATRPPRNQGSSGRNDRLPRMQGTTNRGREIRLGVLGVLGLAVLVVGVPAALVVFVGYPLPRSAPSREWLTVSVSATLIIKILACVVWLVWAHFTVCLLSEWRAVRRGRLPSHVPLGGGSQLLARRLVAAALLLAGAATTFGHLGSSAPVARPPAVTAAVHAGTQAAAVNRTAAPQTHGEDSAEHQAPAGSKYYVVQPPHGRRYDSLWDIADRTLKDPLRYKEIFALNRDRVQADGRKLLDANLIMPGWHLRLPADASGPGVHVAPATPPPASKTPQTEATGSGTPATAASGTAHAGAGASAGASHAAQGAGPATARLGPAVTATQPASAQNGSPTELAMGGALMLAGVLLALSARRGPYGQLSEDEASLAMVADPGLADLLDRALRELAAERSAQGRELPQPVVAWVSAEQVVLNLAGGDMSEPPPSWQLGADARSWTRALDGDTLPARTDAPAPYPGLLAVGRDGDFELFVDFEQAPGLVSLGGDIDRARELATAVAVQAATSLWSDGSRVSVVGFGDGAELSQIDPRTVTQVDRLDQVLEGIERDHDDVLRLQRQLGVDGVLGGRQLRRSSAWQPHLIVLSGAPTVEESRRLQELVGDGRSNIVVLVVGETPDARWRFVLDPSGQLDLGVLGASAQAHRVGRLAVAHLVAMLSQAAKDRQQGTRSVAAMTPHHAVVDTATGTSGPRRPSASEASIGVSLLGPVTVDAVGHVEAAKRELATEIVVAVALHLDGLHDAVLRASIWPRGVSENVCEAAMAEVANWLASDRAGRPCLQHRDGRWHLGDAVRIDYEELRQLAEAAAGAGPDELAVLQQAIALFRGRAFSAPAGRYGWLAFARAARDARVVATAVVRRASELLVDSGRRDEAEEALRRGLVLVPDSEVLWRELLVLTGRQGPDGAAAVAEEMYLALRGCRVWPEPETDALVAQLVPGYQGPDPAAAGMAAS